MTVFPLYRSESGPFFPVSDLQVQAISDFKRKIASGEYRLVRAECVCMSPIPEKDTRILAQDRYGIEIASMLCENCGTIRTEFGLDERSLEQFYRLEYRPMYVGNAEASDRFFGDQRVRGRILIESIRPHVGKLPGLDVLEVGCGAGGILQAFKDEGSSVIGCDYGETYLQYGRRRGLDLRTGGIHAIGLVQESQDVLVLMHVLEHFPDPLLKLRELHSYLRPEGLLIVEVPGIFNIFRVYTNPIDYFQFAHPYSYHRAILARLFEHAGFDVVHGDEKCLFVLRRRTASKTASAGFSVKGAAAKVRLNLICARLAAMARVNPYFYRNLLLQARARIKHRRAGTAS